MWKIHQKQLPPALELMNSGKNTPLLDHAGAATTYYLYLHTPASVECKNAKSQTIGVDRVE